MTAVDDGDIAYSVVLGAPATRDPIYAAIDPADVAVTNADNDGAGITVTPVAGLGTTEAGGTASFTVVLTSQPTADVVIPVASSDTTEGTVSAASLTFTAADWNVPQTVTVTGVDDLVDDGDIAYSITLGAPTSSDPIYAAIDPADVSVTNADNDGGGHHRDAGRRLGHHRGGRHGELHRGPHQPAHRDVVIPVASSDTTEGTVSAASLTFTAADWNVPQTVTVTGVDDLVDDGDIAYSVVVGAATLGPDLRRDRSGRRGGDQRRQRRRGHHRDAGRRPRHHRGGRHRELHRGPHQPADRRRGHPGRLQRYHRGHGLGREPDVHRRRLERAADGHRDRRDDAVDDGDIAYSVVVGAPASRPDLRRDRSGRCGGDQRRQRRRGHHRDAGRRLGTTEAGGTASFTVVLNSQPTANVVIPVASSDTTEGTVSAASLTFTAADWNVAADGHRDRRR
jgi:hypothetical protein